MYQTMAFGRTKESQGSGIPAVYECGTRTACQTLCQTCLNMCTDILHGSAGGFVQTVLGTHIWMSMQLLGNVDGDTA